MFTLDPRTVIFVNFCYSFAVSCFIIIAGIIQKYHFKGHSNWIIGFILLTTNFLMLSLRSIIPVPIVIIVPHLLTVWAYIEIKRGLAYFYKIKNRIFTDFIIFTSCFILLMLSRRNSQTRILILSLCAIAVYVDTIVLFLPGFFQKERKGRTIILFYSLAIMLLLTRMIIGLQWDPQINPMMTGNSLAVISILLFINNIVIFFLLFFIVVSRVLHDRNDLINKLHSVTLTDELSGLMNRRGFKSVLKAEMERYKRFEKGFVFAIGDIDLFKSVNDTYGHDCGDYVIQTIAKLLQHSTRKVDIVARWGGEEFVLLFPETDSFTASTLCERIRKTIEEYHFHYEEHSFHKTFSLGVCFINSKEITVEQIILTADTNLYQAKNSGRNRIVSSEIIN